MLYCPVRSPTNISRRLPGGFRRSSSLVADPNIRSFRRATFARSLGKPFGIRSAQMAAVRLSANDRITVRYVWRITTAVKARAGLEMGAPLGTGTQHDPHCAILPDEFLGWDLDPAAGGGVKRRGAFPKSGACGPQGLFENGPVLRFHVAAVLGRSSALASVGRMALRLSALRFTPWPCRSRLGCAPP
jgi:hypothetical protein